MALVVCLILLTALTVLGLAAAADARLHTRMAGNIDSLQQANSNAEASLRWAEAWLLGLDGAERPRPCTTDCVAGSVIRLHDSYPSSPEHKDSGWWHVTAFRAGHDPVSGMVLDSGQSVTGGLWLIEEIQVDAAAPEQGSEIAFYRIIARSTDPDGDRVTILESIVARPWGDPAWRDAWPRTRPHERFCIAQDLARPCGRIGWQQRR